MTTDNTIARDVVLARIRQALGRTGSMAASAEPVAPDVPRRYRHTGEHPPGSPALVDLFVDRLEDYRARVARSADDHASIASTVRETVVLALSPNGTEDHADGGEVQDGILTAPGIPTAWVSGIGTRPDLGTMTPAELDAVPAVVTGSVVAIAETGTIVLDGSPLCGRRALTLVPDVHICVVRTADVVQTVPEALARLDPSRPLTFVSGPSATSDIELTRVEGVHGPRTLAVILAG